MPATYEKSAGDESTFWMVTYAIGGRKMFMQLIGPDTAFGTKHLLNSNHESAEGRKDRRDIKVGDTRDKAIAMCEFLNFNGSAVATNTVIEYKSESELHLILADVADAFAGVAAWPASPQLKEEEITFSTSCVRSTGAVNKVANKVKLGAFLKGQNGNNTTIVIKHLAG
ncbi:MAG TPA: hypothetical protein VGY56_12525 [Verrucomicrobiae bacterium]|nr:hypothetical protein [Verrucomicrobiae bacterium]